MIYKTLHRKLKIEGQGNTKTKRTMIYKTLHRKLKIEGQVTPVALQ